MASKRLFYPAADRNKDPILAVLKQYICRNPGQRLLEIASGSGQHVAFFAPHFPKVTFYPSECESRLLESIAAHCEGLTNVVEPMLIDVTTDYRTWPGGNSVFQEGSFNYIYNANLMHIAPFECTVALFRNAGKLLRQNGIMFTYGPYAVNGKLYPDSNVKFDENLRLQNSEWGIRDIEDLKRLGQENGMQLFESIEMPANNKTLIWHKLPEC